MIGIRREARKFGVFRPYIINKKRTIHECDAFMYLTQNVPLVVYTFKQSEWMNE